MLLHNWSSNNNMSFSQKQRLFVVITSLESYTSKVNGEINFGILPNSFRYLGRICLQLARVYLAVNGFEPLIVLIGVGYHLSRSNASKSLNSTSLAVEGVVYFSLFKLKAL